MRQVAGRTLWLGNPGDTRNVQTVLRAGIEAIVELADNEPLAVLPRELIRCRFPLSDGGENPTWLLRMAAESVATFLRVQAPVLVCCSGGMNRSVCIAAAGVALADNRPLMESLLTIVESGPADVSPGLLAQVQLALERSR
jgi:hypothetical protein